MAYKNIFGSDKVCAVCKKNFFTFNATDYAWKNGNKYFCSYSCLNKYKNKYSQPVYLRGAKGE